MAETRLPEAASARGPRSAATRHAPGSRSAPAFPRLRRGSSGSPARFEIASPRLAEGGEAPGRGSRSEFEGLANDLRSEANRFLDQADPFPGPVRCPVSSPGQLSGQRTARAAPAFRCVREPRPPGQARGRSARRAGDGSRRG